MDSDNQQLVSGIEKFIVRFNDISVTSSSRLATALHNFGAKIKVGANLTSGQIHRGERIGVQATASGRRKYSSRGTAPMIAGRPRSSYINLIFLFICLYVCRYVCMYVCIVYVCLLFVMFVCFYYITKMYL